MLCKAAVFPQSVEGGFFILKKNDGLLWIIVIKDAVMLGIGLSIYSVSTLLASHQEDYLLVRV